MNEAKKNIWKPIAIVALVIALIACAAVVYLMNRAPEKEIVEPEGNYTVSGDNARGYVVTGVVQ